MVYDTGHAIGLVREDGMEVLIHVGINTVELGGKYYTAKVSNGQKIKKGDLLLEFDMDEIAKAGYSLVTPVIVTNSDEYEGLTRKEHGRVEPGDQIITGSC